MYIPGRNRTCPVGVTLRYRFVTFDKDKERGVLVVVLVVDDIDDIIEEDENEDNEEGDDWDAINCGVILQDTL